MIVQRWNPFAHAYEPAEINDTWHISVYESDMQTEVRCPACGRILPFGETYCSREFHTAIGFGYGVCEPCYMKEWDRHWAAEDARAEK